MFSATVVLATALIPSLVFAGTGDLFLMPDRVKFSSDTFLEGKTARLYATVDSSSNDDLRGVVKFFDGEEQIQGDQPVSVLASKEDAVFVDWRIDVPGEHTIRIALFPFEAEGDNPGNNTVQKQITVFADSDRDGTANRDDVDDDNDGYADAEDAFPLNRLEWIDSDGDSKGDNADDDDDNDGIPDERDAFPLNSAESVDTDKDGIGDKHDTFPLDPVEKSDFDKDGIGDNKDQDADNDGIPKPLDTNDTNVGPVIKITSKKKARRRIILSGETVSFETTESGDPDGNVASSEIIIEGKKIKGDTVEVPFEETGVKIVSVRLTDDKGEAREENFKVLVIPKYGLWVGTIFIFLIAILAIFYLFSYSRHAHENRYPSKILRKR